MRTIVAIAIMLLVSLLAGLMLYILLRRAAVVWIARTEARRGELLERELAGWFSGSKAAAPPQLKLMRRWPDRRLFVQLCLERLPRAEPALRERLVQWLDDHGFIDRWVMQLRKRDAYERAQAAELLGIVRVPRTVQPLVESLEDPELDVRMRAAAALGAMGGQQARGALIDALSDEDRWAAIRVVELLGSMGPDVLDELYAAYPRMGRKARLAVLDIVARIAGPEAGPFLVNLLHVPDIDIRARAAMALGRVGYREAAASLGALLDDKAWPVRAMAAKSLGILGATAAIPQLRSALRDREWWVRANSAHALAALGPAGMNALAQMLDDEDRFARDQAKAMLVELEAAS